MRALTNVRVRLTGNGGGVITVTPPSFASVTPGHTYQVRIHLATPGSGHRGAYVSNVQLRQGHRNLGPPLHVRLRVPRPGSGDSGSD